MSDKKITNPFPCPVYKKCGGCQLQNLSDSDQLALKQKKVERLLRKLCKVEKIIGMDNPRHYRNKVQAAFYADKRGKIISGVYQSGSHHVVGVDSCLIEDETVLDAYCGIGTIGIIAAKYGAGRVIGAELNGDAVRNAIANARANKLLSTKDTVIANGREMMTLLFDTTEQEAERDRLLEEAQVVSDAVQQHIYENAHVALDQAAYNKKHDSLTARYNSLKEHIEDLNEQISQTQSQKGSIEDFLSAFEKMQKSLSAFSLDAFNALTDYLTVNGDGDIDVTFRNGQTIKA